MATPVTSDLEFSLGAKVSGLPPATAPGQPLTYEQLGGSNPIRLVTLDFGAVPVYSKQFTIALPGAVTSQNVLMQVSAKMPAGVDLDELEMDFIDCAAYVSAAGTITVLATANPGPVTGQRNFSLQVG